VLVDELAAGVVCGAAADALVGVTAGAVAGAVVGTLVGVTAGVVAGAEPGVADAGGAAVTVSAGDGADVAPLPLADAVLAGEIMLATRTPTPSAAPLSSVT
jgi:hypothetical protein